MKRTMRTTITICFLLWLLIPTEAQHFYMEDSSLVVVEVESTAYAGWNSSEASVGVHDIDYLYGTKDYFSNPGNQLLSYQIKINNPGTYRFIWHNKVGKGTDYTEHNDDWLSIPGAADFYGEKNGHVVHPHGICTNDCPNGAGSGGWFKVYSNGTDNWTWRAKTSDNDAHDIYARFDTVGIYTIQISSRSAYHFLNRFVLFKESVYTEAEVSDLSLKASTAYHFNVDQPIWFIGAEPDTITISGIHPEIDSLFLVTYDSLLLDSIHVEGITQDNSCNLIVKPQKNASGEGIIELKASHADGEPFRLVYEFNLIKYINAAPTIDQIEDLELMLDEGATHSVTLAGLFDGNDGTQELSVSIIRMSSSVITTPQITYTQGEDTALLQFQMKAPGEVNIAVTVQDDGGTDLGGSNSTMMRFKVTVSGTTDVIQHESDPELISIYPNPADQHLHIVSGADILDEFEVYNMSGNRFLAGKFPGKTTVDVEGLVPGAYILKCYSGKTMVKALQFIKQ